MRKKVNEDREHKVWCMGADLRLLQAISYPDEEWDYVQRLVCEPLGDCYLVSNMGRAFNTGKQELCRLYPDKDGTKYTSDEVASSRAFPMVISFSGSNPKWGILRNSDKILRKSIFGELR